MHLDGGIDCAHSAITLVRQAFLVGLVPFAAGLHLKRVLPKFRFIAIREFEIK